ncbi:MAG: hypothetical protein JWO86_980, partial [Myxococcaceae bacterium]|nr:hypothetical protein [Myxococcaceae bacterium]
GRAHPALGLVRAQLVIVYVFSALNKLTHGFGSGRSLVHLLGGAASTSPSPFSPVLATALSLLVIATELAIPVVLVYRPRAGIGLVVAMHVAFALLVPGVISFGIAMSALSVLFAGRPRSSA